MTYNFRQTVTDSISLANYAKLLRETFPQSTRFTVDYLKWLYADCPIGTVQGTDAFCDDELAAHYVTIPVEYRFGPDVRRGVLSLNTATLPAHQGKGLFTRLAESTYATAALEGYDFVIGVGNASSTPGFVKKLGFSLLGPLDVLVGNGFLVSDQAACRASEQVLISRNWEPELLRWRLKNPTAHYNFINSGNSTLVLSKTPYSFTQAQIFQTDDSALGNTIRDTIPKSSNWIKPGRIFIGTKKYLNSEGLWTTLPNFLRPSPWNLIFRWLRPGLEAPNIDQLKFEIADYDTF